MDLLLSKINTKWKNKRELVELCTKNAIETKELIERKKVGWVGKSKGLLQVLWERGFIDETSIEKYKLTGKNDDFGIVDNSTSLRHMMTMCSDFLHEQGMMEFIGRKVGVEVILSGS